MVFRPATELTTLPTSPGFQDPHCPLSWLPSLSTTPHCAPHTGCLVPVLQKAVRVGVMVYTLTGASQAPEECPSHDRCTSTCLLLNGRHIRSPRHQSETQE